MNQKAFLSALEAGLRGLPPREIDEILADYQEYFRDAQEAGRTEDEVVQSLGDPAKLAKELRAQVRYRQWEESKSVGSLFRVVAAVAGLGLMNFLLAIPFMLYLSLLTAGWITSVTFFGVGAFLLCIGGINAVSGWPDLSLRNDWLTEGTLTFAAAENGEAAPLGDEFDPSDNDVTIRLRGGDSVTLVYRNGDSVRLRGGAGGVKIDSSGPSALKADSDGEITLPKHELRSYALRSAEGDQVSMKLDGEAGLAELHIETHDGGKVVTRLGNGALPGMEVSQELSSHETLQRTLNAEIKAKLISSDAAERILNAAARDGGTKKDTLHITGLKGMSVLKALLLVGAGMLVAGVVGVLFCFWLTRWTWRGVVALVKAQVALLSPSDGS
ncbi:DUF1700 domain-containing protein [Paludibacterium paludis]|uniref:DUF1700 domain-containing protein n=1 Tax=Paludibacterium paludis TaxID=1225769 RepID=A0A918U869_9NEIS|nr:DUF1700 domain-containing protein [Paludibacterium paludis]GGY07905.1 hypothetical protein GCM10011289_08090 [Paludibacterium paludis]